ncbi:MULTISPECIES: helix-turn-helix domain-containing protein [Amniculibacterium]|uniref:helix-turn-helix domain-containing protein n=1 Tax=Amniculibacterium TaxID=2715289 RepID=UPI000F5B81F8|nr:MULTISPECIES: helix-turn-helix transcriptional regulator [Amniculibacterium]
MTLNERISKIIEYSQFSLSEFADEIDVQRSSISHITSGRNKPSLDFLIKVKDRFPELQWDWLIKNEGEMLASEKNEAEENAKLSTTSLPDLFTLIDDDIYGKTESEDRILKEVPRDLNTDVLLSNKFETADSQRLENKEKYQDIQKTENQDVRIKKIVIFYENGKFESYEP